MRDAPYQCHNRAPFKKDQVLYHMYSYLRVVQFRTTVIPFRMSTDCQYTKTHLGQIDPGCTGCKWRMEEPSCPPTPA